MKKKDGKERIFIIFPNLRFKVNSGHGRKIWQVLKLHRMFWQKLVYLRVNQPEAYKLGNADVFYNRVKSQNLLFKLALQQYTEHTLMYV